MSNGVPDGMSDGLPGGLHNGGVPMTEKIPTLQMVCISDSRQCNAGCPYCPSRGLPVKQRLPLPDLKRVVDYFVAHTNRAATKPRELSFVLNTLGEPTLGIDNVTGIADYVAYINSGGACAVPVYFFMSSTNLMETPDGVVNYADRLGYLTVSLHGRPAAEFAERLSRFDDRVTTEGSQVILKRPMNLLARYREIMEHFDLASLYPVKAADMTLADAALWVEEFSECFRALEPLSDADLSDFLSRLSFNDTIMNELRLLVVDAKLTHKCGAGIFSLQVTPKMEFYPCMFTQYPDLRMGDMETGIDPAWFQRFEQRRRAGAEPECAGCEIVSVCGGCCLDWARKDSRGNGYFSPTECFYRRGLVKAAKEFIERVKGRPLVMGAIRDRLDLCNHDWRPKRKGG